MVSREELRRLIQNATSSKWTETYAEFTNRWFSQYESFYLVELEAFAPFNPPILKEEVGFNPPQSYFTEAPEEVVRKLEGHPEEELLIFQKFDTLLEHKGQIILYGPPGSGKTWLAKEYVGKRVPDGREYERTEFVTFHPAFSYEDFVEGIKPVTQEDPNTGKKELLFRVEEGVFKRIARNAYNALLTWAGISKEWGENYGVPNLTPEEVQQMRYKLKTAKETMPKFYLIIDEINRGDIAKIFGELITLLEKDKRLFMEHETLTILPYSKKRFGVPPNLYIIGTMNTSDRSIALIDVALRRRFGFVEMMPDYEVLKREIIKPADENIKDLAEIAISALEILNHRIVKEYDRDHQIGHSYYIRLKEHLDNESEFLRELKMIWFYEILPLLQEYFYDTPEKLKNVLRTKDSDLNFLEVKDGEIIGFKDENTIDEQKFLEMLQSLIEAKRE